VWHRLAGFTGPDPQRINITIPAQGAGSAVPQERFMTCVIPRTVTLRAGGDVDGAASGF